MAKLSQRVWNNPHLTTNTKMKVYQACVLSILLYASESWTTYARHEKKLNTFHLRCLRRILHIKWQDKVSNSEVLERAKTKTLYSILRERRLRWLGHVKRMEPGRIPKDLLYSELEEGTRPTGRPKLRFKDVCKRDLKLCDISSDQWEHYAVDRDDWRHAVKQGVKRAEEAWLETTTAKRARHKERKQRQIAQPPTQHLCLTCGRDCHSRLGLHSHSRACKKKNQKED